MHINDLETLAEQYNSNIRGVLIEEGMFGPMGVRDTLKNKIGQNLRLTSAGRANSRAYGQAGAQANQMYKTFTTYLGTVQKDIKDATWTDLRNWAYTNQLPYQIFDDVKFKQEFGITNDELPVQNVQNIIMKFAQKNAVQQTLAPAPGTPPKPVATPAATATPPVATPPATPPASTATPAAIPPASGTSTPPAAAATPKKITRERYKELVGNLLSAADEAAQKKAINNLTVALNNAGVFAPKSSKYPD